MNWNDLAILLILVVLVVILAFIRPVFLTPNNLLNIMRQVSIVAILGIGMTYVLISAEIDLSVGSLVALSGVVVAMMLKSGVPIPISILAGILVSVGCGFLNGAIHTFAKIPSFIVTMGMMNIARGIVLVITNSYPITGLPDSLKHLGVDTLLYTNSGCHYGSLLYIRSFRAEIYEIWKKYFCDRRKHRSCQIIRNPGGQK